MSKFQNIIRSGRVLLMDGAMGTELQLSPHEEGACLELWNLTAAERVKAVHQSYVAAGAKVFLTNTFQANPSNLAKHGVAERLLEIFAAAIAHARAAAGADRFVLADVGPFDSVDAATASLIVTAAQSADGLLLETWSDPSSIRLFSEAISAQPGPRLPLLVSFTFWRPGAEADLCTFTKSGPEACAEAAEVAGAVALGVNCGRGLTPDDVLEIIHRYHAATDLPIFARPNAGTPIRAGDRWVYPDSPETMAARLRRVLQAGVCMVGGCCGTTPAHIAAFRAVMDEWQARTGRE